MIKDFFGQLGIDEVKSLSEVYYISIVGDIENENIVKGEYGKYMSAGGQYFDIYPLDSFEVYFDSKYSADKYVHIVLAPKTINEFKIVHKTEGFGDGVVLKYKNK